MRLRLRVGGKNFTSSSVGTHERLEQRVAGQAVCAMQSRARHFTDSVEISNFGFAVDIRQYSAALVVGGRHDRDRFFSNVDPEAKAGLVNVRKSLADEIGGFVRDIEPDVVRTALLHLAVNCAGDNISRRERTHRMVRIHEFAAIKGF